MNPSPFDLTGRVALVTGAYRGLGFAIAKGMADAGATVVLNGRRKADLEAAARSIPGADIAVFDVTKREAIMAAIDAVIARHGHIDILVNNAGIQRRAPFAEFPQADWDDIIATNLTAPFVVSQAVVPGMITRKQGKIIHIASLLSDLARPTVVPYTAAKGGVRQLTRNDSFTQPVANTIPFCLKLRGIS